MLFRISSFSLSILMLLVAAPAAGEPAGRAAEEKAAADAWSELFSPGAAMKYGEPAKYFDWEWAKQVWREAEDFAALQREFDKCRAAYEPWRAAYLEHEYNALEALKTHPERSAIERCDDMRRAYEYWRENPYRRWKARFGGTDICSRTFEEIVAWRRGQVCDDPYLMHKLECGSYPDWRTDEDKAKDRARDAEFASIEGYSRERRREKCRERRAREAAEKEEDFPL